MKECWARSGHSGHEKSDSTILYCVSKAAQRPPAQATLVIELLVYCSYPFESSFCENIVQGCIRLERKNQDDMKVFADVTYWQYGISV